MMQHTVLISLITQPLIKCVSSPKYHNHSLPLWHTCLFSQVFHKNTWINILSSLWLNF